jgi:hypothetical protein
VFTEKPARVYRLYGPAYMAPRSKFRVQYSLVRSATLSLELLTLNSLPLHHCKAKPTTFAGFLVQTVYSSSGLSPNASM